LGEGRLVRDSLDARPTQHRALRQITEAFARVLSEGLKECLGKEVPVFFAYQGDAQKKPHLTLINYWNERVTDRHPDRVLCKTEEGDEFFRAPPLILNARYILTAWAPPLDDQELYAAALRVLHDHTDLTPRSDEPDEKSEDAVHWEDHPTIELSSRFTLDEARIVCDSLGMPLRQCVRYDVSYRLDSERKSNVKRVRERIVDYKKLDA
jgi:hypothetical protein